MEVTKEIPTPVPMPGETLQATFRINIKIAKNSSTGDITTYITELDTSNYDGLIPNVPSLLKEFNLSYSLDLLQHTLISAAR